MQNPSEITESSSLTTAELLQDVATETGEISTETMDLLYALTCAEGADSLTEQLIHLQTARNVAEAILWHVKDQISRFRDRPEIPADFLRKDANLPASPRSALIDLLNDIDTMEPAQTKHWEAYHAATRLMSCERVKNA